MIIITGVITKIATSAKIKLHLRKFICGQEVTCSYKFLFFSSKITEDHRNYSVKSTNFQYYVKRKCNTPNPTPVPCWLFLRGGEYFKSLKNVVKWGLMRDAKTIQL